MVNRFADYVNSFMHTAQIIRNGMGPPINRKKTCLRKITLHVSTRCFDFNLPEKIISDARICESGSPIIMHTMEEVMLNLRQDCQNHHPLR